MLLPVLKSINRMLEKALEPVEGVKLQYPYVQCAKDLLEETIKDLEQGSAKKEPTRITNADIRPPVPPSEHLDTEASAAQSELIGD